MCIIGRLYGLSDGQLKHPVARGGEVVPRMVGGRVVYRVLGSFNRAGILTSPDEV
jgi:hypothetical protein